MTLFEAVSFGTKERNLRSLLASGFEVNTRHRDGMTALMYATKAGKSFTIWTGHGTSSKALRFTNYATRIVSRVGVTDDPSKFEMTVKILLESDVDVTARDYRGNTALHYVLEETRYEISFSHTCMIALLVENTF